VIVDPAVQPVVVKSNSPCGNVTPGGGGAGTALTATYWLTPYVHPAPPPVKLAVMFPVPVADGAVYVVTAGASSKTWKAASSPAKGTFA